MNAIASMERLEERVYAEYPKKCKQKRTEAENLLGMDQGEH